MRFTNVRIPRDNLLDRFATVDRGGKYSSPYSPNKRFAATLGELTGGRVGLTCGSLGVLKARTILKCAFTAPMQGSSCVGEVILIRTCRTLMHSHYVTVKLH